MVKKAAVAATANDATISHIAEDGDMAARRGQVLHETGTTSNFHCCRGQTALCPRGDGSLYGAVLRATI
jgi:hypothetical protein